jgi:hypothetical protein
MRSGVCFSAGSAALLVNLTFYSTKQLGLLLAADPKSQNSFFKEGRGWAIL